MAMPHLLGEVGLHERPVHLQLGEGAQWPCPHDARGHEIFGSSGEEEAEGLLEVEHGASRQAETVPREAL